MFCAIPTKWPDEVLPVSLVKVRNTPFPLTEHCLVGSPWAHHAPMNPELAVGPCCGGPATARVVSNWRPITAAAIDSTAMTATVAILSFAMSPTFSVRAAYGVYQATTESRSRTRRG